MPIAALCLLGAIPLVDLQILTGNPWAAFLSLPLLAGYFAFSWGRLMLVARILLILCAGLVVFMALRPDGVPVLVEAIGRGGIFPALVAMLGLLRAAANASPTTAAAGALLVRQPPGRRYLALTLGGHIFGILLNIGGLALLVDMTRRANTREAGFGDDRIVAMRERRMTLAVMRGFACIALWSPLGMAMNLLLASVPGLAWADIAPWGATTAVLYMALGYLFDRWENPRPTRPPTDVVDPVGIPALLRLIGHIVALSVAAFAAEELLGLTFQAALVNLVPLHAACWLVALALSPAGSGERGREGIGAFVLRRLRDDGVARWPTYANEVAVFAASGFLGVVLSTLAPREALQTAIAALALPPGLFAALLTLLVVVLGFCGLNPMISASILAATVTSLDVPGLGHEHVVLAVALGWALVIGVAPLMSSLVMTAALIGRRSREVGLIWNGRFSLAALGLGMLWVALVRP